MNQLGLRQFWLLRVRVLFLIVKSQHRLVVHSFFSNSTFKKVIFITCFYHGTFSHLVQYILKQNAHSILHLPMSFNLVELAWLQVFEIDFNLLWRFDHVDLLKKIHDSHHLLLRLYFLSFVWLFLFGSIISSSFTFLLMELPVSWYHFFINKSEHVLERFYPEL